MSAIVPWTYPGGPSCCCGHSCPSSLITSWAGTDYARVFLSAEEYNIIKNDSAEITVSTTATISGSTFVIGTVASVFPPLTASATFSFPQNPINLFGFGPTRCYQTVTSSVTLVFLYNAAGSFVNAQYRAFNFTAVLQDAGQGIEGDYPLAQPALYLRGDIARVFGISGDGSYLISFGGSNSSGATAFGQGVPLKKTTPGNLVVNATLAMGLAAP